MVKAVIDIGSNSTLLLIAKKSESGEVIELENESEVTALGKDLDKNGVFCQESMELARTVLTRYKKIIDKHSIDIGDVWMSATEASRVAKNAKDFYKEIEKELGLKVSIISGEGEAYYTALGVAKGIKASSNDSIILDVGGASTEFIRIEQKGSFKIKESISIPVGSVRGTDWLKNGSDYFSKLVDENLEKYTKNYKSKELIAVAGTMTSLSAMIQKCKEFSPEKIHNHECRLEDLIELENDIKDLSVSDIGSKFPFLGKRAQTIHGGLKVIIKIGKFLSVEKFIVSTYGLRYGVFLSGEINEQFIQY